MSRRCVWGIASISALACYPAAAVACPYCETEIGRQVRAGIFNDDFWLNALLTLLPIPAMLLIVALIHYGPPWPGRRPRSTQDDGQNLKLLAPETERIAWTDTTDAR